MNPHWHLIALAIIAFCAVLFEAEWIMARLWNGNSAKLPHRVVLSIRWGAVAAYLACWHLPWWSYALHFVLMAALLGPAHSIGLNLRRRQRWYYLGPLKRTKGDSLWDTLFIRLASPPGQPVLGGVVYHPKPAWLPMFFFCLACLVLAVLAHTSLVQLVNP